MLEKPTRILPSGRPGGFLAAMPTIRMAGFILTAAGLFSSLAVSFASLPPFYTGIWFQTEPMMIAYVGSAVLSTLGLLLLSWVRPDVVGRLGCHPFVAVPAGLALWSLAVAPWARAPGLSIFGTPEMGQGAIWFLSFAVLTAGAMAVYRQPRLRSLVAGSSLVVAWSVALLTLHDRMTPPPTHAFRWVPLFFPDYLAFFGIFSSAIALVWLPRKRTWGTAAILASWQSARSSMMPSASARLEPEASSIFSSSKRPESKGCIF